MKPDRDIRVLIKQRPRLMEGAMGTLLAARGIPAENTGERNLTHPEVVAEIHHAYRLAGSEIFQSNSFAANRPLLERAGLGEQVAEIQKAAMRIVRRAVGEHYPCGANLGPTGRLLEPYGDMSRDEAVAIYREQLENQLPEEPDFILFETFEDLEELAAAFEAAHQLAPHLPKVTCVSFSNPNGTTMMGVNGARAAEKMIGLGADVIGTNCGHLDGLRIGIREIARLADRPLVCQPNAGLPELVSGATKFRGTPAEAAELAREFLDLGVRLLGGCCGTTPDHIRAMAEVVARHNCSRHREV
ncbi:MAG: homocysteine S-methyltransferase family protein [Candidatus Zipacnadales bacterium]